MIQSRTSPPEAPGGGGGLPSRGGAPPPAGPSSFNEVELVASALGYRLVTIGGVSIVDHPRLGKSIYIGSVVTDAEPDEIRSALNDLG